MNFQQNTYTGPTFVVVAAAVNILQMYHELVSQIC